MSSVVIDIFCESEKWDVVWWVPGSKVLGYIRSEGVVTRVTPNPRPNPDPKLYIAIVLRVGGQRFPIVGVQHIRFPALRRNLGWDLSEVVLVVEGHDGRSCFTWNDLVRRTKVGEFRLQIVRSKLLKLGVGSPHIRRPSLDMNVDPAYNWTYHGPVATHEWIERSFIESEHAAGGRGDVHVLKMFLIEIFSSNKLEDSWISRPVNEIVVFGPRNKMEVALLGFHLILTLQRGVFPKGSLCSKYGKLLVELGHPVVYDGTILGAVDFLGELTLFDEDATVFENMHMSKELHWDRNDEKVVRDVCVPLIPMHHKSPLMPPIPAYGSTRVHIFDGEVKPETVEEITRECEKDWGRSVECSLFPFGKKTAARFSFKSSYM